MQQRRGTASQWTIADPVLAAGEIGVESDTAKFKIGDGVNTWSNLDYFETSTQAGATFIEDSEKGANDGVATLDGTGNVPAAQLSNVDFTGYATEAYADQAETDAVTSANSYTDTAIGNLIDSAPTTLDTLNELAAALGDDANFASTVTNSLANKSDVGHTHAISDVTSLQSSLDAKADLSGATFTGRVTASDSTEARFSVRNIYISTSDPSGGTDGDVWLKYE